MERLFFRGQQNQIQSNAPGVAASAPQINVNPGRGVVSTVQKSNQNRNMKMKNSHSVRQQDVSPDRVKARSELLAPNSEDESEISFEQIVNDKPSPRFVSEYIQKFINKLAKENDSETSDYDSSEYQTDK